MSSDGMERPTCNTVGCLEPPLDGRDYCEWCADTTKDMNEYEIHFEFEEQEYEDGYPTPATEHDECLFVKGESREAAIEKAKSETDYAVQRVVAVYD